MQQARHPRREREPAGGPDQPGGEQAGPAGGSERQQECVARHLPPRGHQLASTQEAGHFTELDQDCTC